MSLTVEPLRLRRRHHQVLRLLWPTESLSRRDLQRRLDVHPNLIGDDISHLLKHRLVSEGESMINGRGRPGIPLRIDASARHLIGLAIGPGGVQLSKVNLLGQPMGPPTLFNSPNPRTLIQRTAALLRESIDSDTLAIGASTTGLVDPAAKMLLSSSATPDAFSISLAPIYDAAGETPMIVQNDMHALAARWLLGEGAATHEDVLLVLLEDGRMGGAMLINGSPNQGCAIGANEIGHMRFPVHTPVCFCRHEGCLERIFSSEQLAMTDPGANRSLAEAMADGGAQSPAAAAILGHLCNGLANATNFVRPHRLIITGSFVESPAFFDRLQSGIQPLLLAGLSDRMKIERWSLPTLTFSEVAAWVALVDLLNIGV